ncbi:hypothetical protein VV1062A_03120 [Vibrio vulnificus]|nr:hypothetical protein VV1062A_03120 [Vibrio vulnificus]OJI57831.1 hypothetical protein VFL11327_02234 [Vibrio fluvialis]
MSLLLDGSMMAMVKNDCLIIKEIRASSTI